MSLTKLISGQRITIDAHRRGTGQPNNFNDPTSDIHIHKEVYRDPRKYVIRVPLQPNRSVSVNCVRQFDKVPPKILKEIQEVLNEQKTRERLYHEVFEELQKYQWLWNKEDAKSIISKISSAFGLHQTDSEIEADAGRYFAQMYSDGQARYQVVLNYEKQCLHIGEYYMNWPII